VIESAGASFGHFLTWVWGWAIKGGTVIAVLWFMKHALQVLLSGGHGREAWRAVVGILVVAVAFAALRNVDQAWTLTVDLGQRIWDAGLAELRAGLS
jgi:hypothetical protein